MYKQIMTLAFAIAFAPVSGLLAAEPSERLPSTSPMTEGTTKAATPESAMPPPLVEGEVLKIDHDFYVVKDRRGKEVKIQLDQRTVISGSPKVGDQVIAQTAPQGYAYSIKREDISTDSVAGQPAKRTGPPAASDVPGEPSSGDVRSR